MKLIIANLKMNLTFDEILNYKKTINTKYDNLIIAPSYIYLRDMQSENYLLASQDGYQIDKGAYTGEVSFNQLKSIGVNYSIVGHSERRHKFNETNEIVKEKYNQAINNNVKPILCVGETKEERLSNRVKEVIDSQLVDIIKDTNVNESIIAYEPVWAIGTGLTPNITEIEEVHKYIKDFLKKYNVNPIVLYGGSVNLDNIKSFNESEYIDGFLIGGASLDPNNLIKMIEQCK